MPIADANVPNNLCRVEVIRFSDHDFFGDGSPHLFELSEKTTVADLRELITNATGYPTTGFLIGFKNDWILSDDFQLCPILKSGYHDITTLQIRNREGCGPVFVKTMLGKIFNCNLYPKQTVADLKSFINSTEGVPLHQQILIWRKNEMEDGE